MSPYKPNKKKLENGLIANRLNYFYTYGYEYTFYCTDIYALRQWMANWFATQNQRLFKMKPIDEKPDFIIGVPKQAVMEVFKTESKETVFPNGLNGYAVSFVAAFNSWADSSIGPYYGDEMNEMLTVLEKGILQMDPLAWVRMLPAKTHLTNGIGSRPELWEVTSVDRTLTREAASEKKLEEGYLADILSAMGVFANGGTIMARAMNAPVNPLIAERVERNLKREEERKNAPPEENGAQEPEENTLIKYTAYFEVSVGEFLDPFIHAQIDENKNIIPEPLDQGLAEIPLAGVTLYAKRKGEQRYSTYYSNSMNHDNFMYISNSRIAFINRKYNKDEGGGWIGFGTGAAIVAEAINLGSKAVNAVQRRDKALAGHLRYEWIGVVGYRHKQGMMGHESIRFVYRDLENTKWLLHFDLAGGIDAELLANDVLRRASAYRLMMTDQPSDETCEILMEFANGKPMERNSDPKEFSSEVIPECYAATKGAKFRPTKL
ncbi:MAG: hypothetical protein J6Y58_10435 [Clostridiales bacterium]|nr:hypothetical protein [Clostridiales bacterium]